MIITGLEMLKEARIPLWRGLTGFAAGVMVAVSVWSLLIPSMEQAAAMGAMAFIPAVAGFWAGVLVLLLLGRVLGSRDGAANAGAKMPEGGIRVLTAIARNVPRAVAIGVVLTVWRSGAEALSPYLMSFAAGIIQYAVVEEFIPQITDDSRFSPGILSFALGFTLMLVLV